MNANQYSVSLADRVFERLERDIIAGVYHKGEILTELRLVDELGVSRTPIREALRRLASERLIEETPKGSVVLGITRRDLEDILNMRVRIEGLIAYYAAQNRSEEQLEEMRTPWSFRSTTCPSATFPTWWRWTAASTKCSSTWRITRCLPTPCVPCTARS